MKQVRAIDLCKYDEPLITLAYYNNTFYYLPVSGCKGRFIKKYHSFPYECEQFLGMHKPAYSRRLEGPFIEMLWQVEKVNASELFGGFLGNDLGRKNFLSHIRKVDVVRDTALSPLSVVRGETAYPEAFEKLYIASAVSQAEDFFHLKQTSVDLDYLLKAIAEKPECAEYLHTEIEKFCHDQKEKDRIRVLINNIEIKEQRQFELALSYILKYHEGEKHISGESCIFQPLVAASLCNSDKGKITALLKDVPSRYRRINGGKCFEDILSKFAMAGIDAEIIEAVRCLNLTEQSYDINAAENDIACEVLFAELYYECDKTRWTEGKEQQRDNHYTRHFNLIRQLYESARNKSAFFLSSEIYNLLKETQVDSLLKILSSIKEKLK